MPSRESDERLAELRQLAQQAKEAAAGSGKWTVGYWPLPEPTHYVGAIDVANPFSSKLLAHLTGQLDERVARYIAAIDPDTLLGLLDQVDAA